jgi:hypothetical protein
MARDVTDYAVAGDRGTFLAVANPDVSFDRMRRVAVDEWLRPAGAQNIFAIWQRAAIS